MPSDSRVVAEPVTAGSQAEPYEFGSYAGDVRRHAETVEFGFPSLDRFVKIRPGAVTLISAATGGGKTSFLLNILNNFLSSHEDKACIFWSYEESSFAILTKLLMIRLGASPFPARSSASDREQDMFQQFLHAVQRPERATPEFRRALGEVKQLLTDGRLLGRVQFFVCGLFQLVLS